MARTAPVPNIPAIPGMNPGVWVLGGGGDGGGGSGDGGDGSGQDQGANGANGGNDANGGGNSACGGTGAQGATGCPNHHGGNSGSAARGDPVDALTGRVFEGPLLDAHIRGRFGVAFERSYSSASPERDVGLGRGWTHGFAWMVEERRRGSVVWNGAGMPLAFEGLLRPGDVGLGPEGMILVRTDFGYVLDEPGGRKLVFDLRIDRLFLLTAIRDAQGNATTLRYEGDRLVEITDPAGRSIRVVRGADGRIASLEMKNAREQGRWVRVRRYEYDDAGDLRAAVDAEACEARYEYVDHRLTRKVDAEGFEFHYLYDAQGRCVETWGTHPDPRRVGLASTVPATLADGTPARGMYHCRFTFGPDRYAEVADSMVVQRLTGNAFGKCDKAVAGGAVYERVFDAHGNLISFTDPNGGTTIWLRDRRGFPLRVTDPLGRVTLYERDPEGNLRSVVDPEGGVTLVEQEPGVMRWTDPVGARFTVTMDERGCVTSTVAPNGAVTRYEHDRNGNLMRKTNALGQSAEWTYDEWGRVLSQRDACGAVESYTYNDRGDRLTVRTTTGEVHHFERDRNGALVGVNYPTGAWMRMDIGIGGKLLAIRRSNGDVRALGYDREGRLVEGANARGERYAFVYDAGGRMVREQTFTGLVKSYKYDPMGLLLEETSSTGDKVEFAYDAAGQLVSRVSGEDDEETFTYDGCGRMVACEGPAGRFEYTRNAAGWLVEERHTFKGETSSVRTKHDVMGHVVHRETSRGYTVDLERDPCGRALRMVLDGAEVIELGYDAAGREIDRRLPGGGRVATRYDAGGRIAERWAGTAMAGPAPKEPGWVGGRPPGTTVYRAHRYDAGGWLAETLDDRTGRSLYERDGAGWLLSVAGEHGEAERYGYDINGNVLPGKTHTRQYGQGNVLLADGPKTYEWDEAGRLRSAKDADGKTTAYRWDGLGRLATVEQPDGRVVSFAYDAFDRRVEKRVAVRTSAGERDVASFRYLWSGGEILHEIRRSAAIGGDPVIEERTYCYDDAIFQPLAQREVRSGGEREPWYHVVADQVGLPEYLLDGEGRVASSFDHTAFGEVRKTGSGPDTPFRFAGQYADEETGLVYNRHRYFDPALGRYISLDPAGLGAGFNGFDYADNAPDRFVDPDGLMPFSVIRNPGGTTDGLDHTEPENRRGERKPLGGNERDRDRTEIPGHQNDGNIVGRSMGEHQQPYRDPAITTAVRNAQIAREVTPTGVSTCSEVDALHQMAGRIRNDPDFQQRVKNMRRGRQMNDEQVREMTDTEIRREIQRRFRNGATIETTNANGEGMAPCPLCAQVFRELGIHPANIGQNPRGGVIGPNDDEETRVRRMGRWDGTFTQTAERLSSRDAAPLNHPSRTPPFTGT